MKKLNFLVFTLALTLTHLSGFSQVVLPSSVNSNREVLPEKVKSFLKDLDAHSQKLTNKESSILSLNNEVLLDFTLTYHVNDLGGGNYILTQAFMEDYAYSDPNLKIITSSIYEENDWHVLFRTRLWYDELGRILVSLAENYNAENEIWEPDSRFRVYPHGDSHTLMDSLLVEGWSMELSGWERLLEVHNTFDQNDKIIESVSNLSIEGIPVIFKDVYFYDDNGFNVLTKTFFVLEGVDIPAGEVEYEYNLGLLSTSLSSVYDELGELNPANYTVYHYNFPSNLVVSVEEFEWDDEKQDWRITGEILTGYDNLFRIDSLETFVYTLEGQSERDLVTNHYREDNNYEMVRHFTYGLDEERYLHDSVTMFFYTEISSLPEPNVVFHDIDIRPNPTQGLVQLNLKADARIEVINISGQVLIVVQGVDGLNTFDISELPSGIYYVRVQTANAWHIGTVIKE